MKLGEGGEAFFVFETSDDIPESLQTSPVISPATSPRGLAAQNTSSGASWQEPEYLDLGSDGAKRRPGLAVYQESGVSIPHADKGVPSDIGMIILPLSERLELMLCRKYNAVVRIPTRAIHPSDFSGMASYPSAATRFARALCVRGAASGCCKGPDL
jgi:hypothetical protein